MTDHVGRGVEIVNKDQGIEGRRRDDKSKVPRLRGEKQNLRNIHLFLR